MPSLAPRGLAACTGLVIAPLLWAANTELGQILPYADCGAPVRYAPILSIVSAALALGGGWASWRARDALDSSQRNIRFVGGLGGLIALVFAFALLLQAAARLVLSGCER